MIGEIDQENSYRWIRKNVFRALSGTTQDIFYDVGRDVVIDPHADAHGMDLRRVMQVDDGLANHLVVRNIEINGVVGAEPSRAPVDFAHLGIRFANLQPIAHLVRPIDLDRHPSNDAAEQILAGEPENDGNDTRAGEQTFQLALGVITGAQNDEQHNQKNQTSDDLA